MRSVKYLDQLLEKHSLKNDLALAKMLGWSSGKISQYRTGTRLMDDETCLAVALALGMDDPRPVLMAAGIDRAEKTGQKSLWEVFSQRMAATASALLFVVAVNLFLTPEKAEAAPVLAYSAAASDEHFILCQMRKALSAIRAWLKRLFMGTAPEPAAA